MANFAICVFATRIDRSPASLLLLIAFSSRQSIHRVRCFLAIHTVFFSFPLRLHGYVLQVPIIVLAHFFLLQCFGKRLADHKRIARCSLSPLFLFVCLYILEDHVKINVFSAGSLLSSHPVWVHVPKHALPSLHQEAVAGRKVMPGSTSHQALVGA